MAKLSFLGQNDLGAQGKDGLQWIQEKSQQKATGGGTRGLPAETAEKKEARGHRSEDKWPRVPHAGPAVPARSVSAPGRGAGPSPAGLSAAIFPPRLEFFPAGGVAPTPAAGLAAGSARRGTTFSSTRLRSPLIRAWTDHGLRK